MLALEDRIVEIRREFPAVERGGYLNTGTVAPMPFRVLAARQERERRFHLDGPLHRARTQALREEVSAVRGKLAELLGVPCERIALAENTTSGINAALLSQAWQVGDEVLTSRAEHPAVELPLAYLERRYGVRVVRAGEPSAALTADEVRESLSARTRAIVISQVSFTSGALFDVPGISAIARERDILTVIDAAQSVGAIAEPLSPTGADFVAFPGYKWLLGPQGTGGLYASERATAAVELPYRIGSHGVASRPPGSELVLHDDARKFEGTATSPVLDIIALGEAVDFLLGYGLAAVAERIAGLCSLFKSGLLELGDAVSLITPASQRWAAGLVSFKLAGVDAGEAAAALYDQGLIVRTVSGNALRASFHLYNTRSEVERLLEAVGRLIREG